MRPLLIAALIAMPCSAQPALELTRNEVPVDLAMNKLSIRMLQRSENSRSSDA